MHDRKLCSLRTKDEQTTYTNQLFNIKIALKSWHRNANKIIAVYLLLSLLQ